MATKIRTGDLFLANKWTLDGIITHAVDQETRWTDVGLFYVDDSDQSIHVYALHGESTRLLEFDTVMREVTLQSAAHRELIHRDRILIASTIKNSINDNLETPKEDIATLIQEYKGNEPERNGVTSAEAIAKILAASKLMMYRNGTFVSNFQEGDSLDQIYGPENPLFPRIQSSNNNNSRNTNNNLEEISASDAINMISDYKESHPISTISNYRSLVTTNNNNNREARSEENLSQSSNPVEVHHKKKVDYLADVDGSIAMQQRLLKQQKDKQLYQSKKPVPK